MNKNMCFGNNFYFELFNFLIFILKNPFRFEQMVNKFDNYTINDPNAIVTSAPLQDEIVQDMTPCRVAGWNPTDSKHFSILFSSNWFYNKK